MPSLSYFNLHHTLNKIGGALHLKSFPNVNVLIMVFLLCSIEQASKIFRTHGFVFTLLNPTL